MENTPPLYKSSMVIPAFLETENNHFPVTMGFWCYRGIGREKIVNVFVHIGSWQNTEHKIYVVPSINSLFKVHKEHSTMFLL